jgi:hypothetical protein
MHVEVEANGLVCIRIMPLRFYQEMLCEIHITPQGFDTVDNVTTKKFKCFTGNDNFAALKSRTAWKFFINYTV